MHHFIKVMSNHFSHSTIVVLSDGVTSTDVEIGRREIAIREDLPTFETIAEGLPCDCPQCNTLSENQRQPDQRSVDITTSGSDMMTSNKGA